MPTTRPQFPQLSRHVTPRLLFLFTFASAAFGGPIATAEDATASPDPAALEFFEKHVRPVLVQRCYECHAAGEVNGGLSLDSRQGVLTGGDIGPAIVPGMPDKSLLIEAIRYKNRDLQMPPQNKIPDAEIAALEKWVAMGAPDPREANPVSASAAPTGMTIEEGREFWSFMPVSDPEIPTVKRSDWVKTPVDAFLLSALEKQNLQPAEPADRRTWLRRVTFNLTGLPPTPQEVLDFVADETPEAYSKVIDRLLSSEQYGVRWGRHWLDVARYADSNGLDENLAFGNAWRYRDYVIDSFNRDKPYDRFVVEQLAGDLLPDANQETKTATAFLTLGAKVLAEPDMEKLVMDTVDEQLDTTGKAFLGMTFGCVRCHDHKFDPIKQTDYYALGAIFKSTRTFADRKMGAIKFWHEHSFATEEEKEELKKVNAEIAAKKSAASSFKSKAMAKIREAAQERATEYLMAATASDLSTPLSEVAKLAEPAGLHPRILHHCRRHLAFNQDDPFFAPWTSLAKQGPEAVEAHYRPLFTNAAAALAEAKKATPATSSLTDPELEAARAAVHDSSGFLAVPPKVEYAFDSETLAEYNRLAEIARIVESNAPDETAVMGVGEQETLEALPIHIRGSHLTLGEPVAREFPEVMRVSHVRPIFPAEQSGRLQLARWMVSTQHPLTARVFVNRVWGWHFGRPLVESTENFGRLGSRPTHPELLDWLAHTLMESGWSLKHLHRQILLSSAYQMSSVHADEQAGQDADPENLLLWKFRLQRLEAEQLRDSILAVAGRLDLTIGGKTVPLRNQQFVFNHTSEDHTKYDSLRRATFLPIIRNNLYTMFEQFDFPDPTMPTGHRSETVVAPQALLMMNSDLIIDSADEFARTLLTTESDPARRINRAYVMAFGREAQPAEVQRALNFVNELTSTAVTASGQPDSGQQQAWTTLCQSLFASNEFVFVR